MVMMSLLRVVVLTTAMVVTIGCNSGSKLDASDRERFCSSFEEYLVLEMRDAGQADTGPLIREVRAALPVSHHDDLALGFYPVGGDVSGLDTSGTNAERARRRIDDLYDSECS